LLRAKNVNTLCMECHGPDVKPARIEATHQVSIFAGKVKLPDTYFAKVPVLPIKYGLGHPVDRHPVASQVDPNDATKTGTEIGCGNCHQPHASAQPGLLVKDQTNNMVFCANCHKDLGK
jgi:predicted CXXCH cytochrome family protein